MRHPVDRSVNVMEMIDMVGMKIRPL